MQSFMVRGRFQNSFSEEYVLIKCLIETFPPILDNAGQITEGYGLVSSHGNYSNDLFGEMFLGKYSVH